MGMHELRLSVLPGEFSICRRDANTPLEPWMSRGSFSSITRTATELSIVVESPHVPEGVKREDDHAMIRFEGPLPFDLIGILASVLTPLAEAGISVFVVSSFDLDYVLLKRSRLAQAVAVLRTAGHSVTSVP